MSANNNDEEILGIYVDLDSLFDLRFALLSVLDPTLVIEEFLSNYLTRKKDSFGYLTLDIFKRFYMRRNVDLLKISRMTPIISFVKEYIETIKMTTAIEGGDDRVNVFVNTYPYDLSDIELETIRKSLFPYFVNAENILVMKKENISPKWISLNCTTVIMYDGNDWINENIANKSLIRHQLLDTIFITPEIMNVREDLSKDDFGTIRDLTKIVVKLTHLPIKQFCLK